MYYAAQLPNSLIQAYPGKHINSSLAPESSAAFISLAAEENRQLLTVQEGIQSYQTALTNAQAFSKEFRDAEGESNKTAIKQLSEIGAELADLVEQVSALPSGQAVPESLRVDLDYARAAIATHRSMLHHSHVFFKINWSLVITSDGILPKKKAEDPELLDRRPPGAKRVKYTY